MHVLLVDDDNTIRKLLKVALEERGYTVTGCRDGKHALETYQQQPVDMIITDIMMPNLNGYDLCRAIRNLPGGDIPITLMITAFGDDQVLKDVLEAGADDYLTKPIRLPVLNIRLTIAEKQLENRLRRKAAEQMAQDAYQHLEKKVEQRTVELRHSNQQLRKEIERRKRTQQALAAEKGKLAITLRSIADGVITIDMKGQVVFMNHAAEQLTGYSLDETIGKSINTIFHITDEETGYLIVNPIQKLLKNELLVHRIALADREDNQTPINLHGVPIHIPNGKIAGIVLVIQDVTEAKKLRQIRANFFNSITHELRTPLTPILGYVRLLGSMDLPEDVLEMLEQVEIAANRERRLVEELLQIARLESGTEHYEFQDINAYELFSFIIAQTHMLVKQFVKDRHQTNQYQYTVSITETLKKTRLKADPMRIQQIIENLITNSIKYSPPDRLCIHFQADMKESYLEFSVTDKGNGIPKSEQRYIFDPFYQVRKTNTDVSNGIGQGLAIVKRYVEAHGGIIHVQSTLDEGSRFTVTIPLHRQGNFYTQQAAVN